MKLLSLFLVLISSTVFGGEALWQGESEGVQLKIFADDIVATMKDRPEFSFKKYNQDHANVILKETAESAAQDVSGSEDRVYSYQNSLRPLSYVKGILSVLVDTGGYTGGAHDFAVSVVEAIDMPALMKSDKRDPSASLAKLTDVFSEAEIFAAMSTDKFLKSKLSKKKFKSLDDLLETQPKDSCAFYMSKDALKKFAFYSDEGKKVGVRIGLSHGCEVARGSLTQIGMTLPVSESLAPALKTGLLMKFADTQFKKVSVSAGWEKKVSEFAEKKK